MTPSVKRNVYSSVLGSLHLSAAYCQFYIKQQEKESIKIKMSWKITFKLIYGIWYITEKDMLPLKLSSPPYCA